MAEFIRIPSRIIDLSHIREIVFVHDGVLVHWHNGETRALTGLDVVFLLDALEQRYGLMTDPAARFWEEEEVAIA